ncbi:hypothetical protein B296_00051696 [Ensete ventricosum]|uniref:Uncharacterized protein n=1 Tax=Ensete ventricosum TaxID=4639 RepID=A0A426X8K3_ENSVE|nr:hypothetical protein B296_00051696 [Ensete ventricosum]
MRYSPLWFTEFFYHIIESQHHRSYGWECSIRKSPPLDAPKRRQGPLLFADAIRTQWGSGGGPEPRAENLPKKVKRGGDLVVLS